MTLRDALDLVSDNKGDDSQWWDALGVILAAARRVAEAPEVWWCEASRAEWPEPDNGEYCGHSPERGCGWVRLVRERKNFNPNTVAELNRRFDNWEGFRPDDEWIDH